MKIKHQLKTLKKGQCLTLVFPKIYTTIAGVSHVSIDKNANLILVSADGTKQSKPLGDLAEKEDVSFCEVVAHFKSEKPGATT